MNVNSRKEPAMRSNKLKAWWLSPILCVRVLLVGGLHDLPLAAQAVQGYVDLDNNCACRIAGWARDPTTSSPIQVRIYRDGDTNSGVLVAALVANMLRTDLPFTDQNHGFDTALLNNPGLTDGKNHIINVYGVAQSGATGLLGDAGPLAATGVTLRCGMRNGQSSPPSKYLIGAYYFAGWFRDPKPSGYLQPPGVGPDWRPSFPEREPWTGWYDDQQALVDQEIGLAAAGGLDFFAFDFYTDRPDSLVWGLGSGTEANLNNGLNFYLTSPNKKLLQFAILYINHNPFNITTAAEWNQYTDQWVGYFKDPQYLKIDGKPLFFVWSNNKGFPTQGFLNTLRQKAASAGFPGVLIDTTTAIGSSQQQIWGACYLGADFLSSYNDDPPDSFPAGAMDYSALLSSLPAAWAQFPRYSTIPYAVNVVEGWDRRAWLPNATEPYFVNETPQKFGQLLQQARDFLDMNPTVAFPSFSGPVAITTIYAWNELGEGGYLIPTKVDGDAYLQQGRKVFGKPSSLSAASYRGILSPASIVTAFGSKLATTTQSAPGPSLPPMLGGTTVAVTDSAGTARQASLIYVSPGQLSFIMPDDTAAGYGTISIKSGDGTVTSTPMYLAPVAPGLFSADGSGTGVAAAEALRVSPDGTQTFLPVFQCGANGCSALPIDLGASGDRTYLIFYGTGVRGRSSLTNVTAILGGMQIPVLYVGPQGTYTGLDQANVEIPAALAGKGVVNVVLVVDGYFTNIVTLNIK